MIVKDPIIPFHVRTLHSLGWLCEYFLIRAYSVENWHEGFISTTHTTAADVWTRRVIVWIVFGSMEVEAMSCKDEWLDAAEMFCEDS